MPTRDVILTDHQDAMIEDLVRSGRYRDASDVFGDALRLIERRDIVEQARLLALRDALHVGVEAMEQGDFVEFSTAEEMIAYLTASTNDLTEARDGDDA